MLDFESSDKTLSRRRLGDFREKLSDFSKNPSISFPFSITDFNSHFYDLCKGVLSYVDSIEQELNDLKVILGTTIEHSTEIENDLSNQHDLILGMWKKYNFIVNNTSEWMGLIDTGYCYDEVNEAFCRVHNATREELLGQSFVSFWGNDFFKDNIQPSLERCIKGEEVSDEIVFNYNGFEEKVLRLDYYPFRPCGDSVSNVFFIGQDITDHKKTEIKLKEKNRVINTIHDALIMLDSDLKITFWNKNSEYLYGWSEKEVAGKSLEDLFFDQDGKQLIHNIIELVKSGSEWNGRMTYFSKNQDKVIVDSKWNLLKGQNKEISFMISNIDVTEKQKLELQFFRSQRTDSIGALASGIAHDLNNVLTVFFIAIKSLKSKVEDEQSKIIVDLLESSTKRGEGLVRQIMNFAKGIEGELAKLDIKVILMELEAVLRQTFPRNIDIHFKAGEGLWKLYGNSTQIYQVLLNLCINAKDAMPEGGTLLLDAQNIILSEDEHSLNDGLLPGNYILLSIKDTGVGISSDVLDKIFEPFFTTKIEGEGTGLGLSVVKTIVKSHNGYLDFSSEIGKGTEFKFYLPAVK
ncbi:MAG: PAS domain S-box protein [bacterium]|nr:PAS domain S-box protein [bacterium]